MMDEILADLLRAPGAQLRETHGSWVVLQGDRALKIKKPVRFPFLDYSSRQARLEACREEVRVNEELAPDIYVGIRAIMGGRSHVGPSSYDHRAVDYAVEMRRYDEQATMAALLAGGRLRESHIAQVADRIARFHARAMPCAPRDQPSRWARQTLADLTDVEGFGGPPAHLRRDFAAAAMRRELTVMEGRWTAGLVRDGHGDLRAEHVLLTTPITIVDRLEFDPTMRCADVADDLAFLAMDLEWLGARWAADLLVEAYAAAGGNTAPPSLAALFAWRRALVRAKVALIRDLPQDAAGLLDLADQLAWRARAPITIAVIGPPASGKSTLATALARRMEIPVVSSDVVRKQLRGLSPTERAGGDAYSSRATADTYAALTERARADEAPDGGVVVDGTFSTAAQRAELESALRGPVHWIVCEAPEAVLGARAAARAQDAQRISDAGPGVAVALARTFEPTGGLERVLRLDTQYPAETLLSEVAAWIDTPPGS